jgi:hypothetical protein
MAKKFSKDKKHPDNMSLKERFDAPVPPFFATLMYIGLSLIAIGGVFTAADAIELNPIFGEIGSYMIVFGSAISAVSKITVHH